MYTTPVRFVEELSPETLQRLRRRFHDGTLLEKFETLDFDNPPSPEVTIPGWASNLPESSQGEE